jgi:hypothetical protein
MNAKKARELRQKLGMSKESLRNPEYGVVKQVKKVVYFNNVVGEPTPTEAVRKVIVNKSLYFYRKTKKQLTRGY